MAYRLDTSPLYRQLPPSAFQQGMAGVGGILEALMERRRMAARQAIEDQQKSDELQFRRDQENRLTKRQEFLDEREENRLKRQDERETRSALADAATKNGGAALPSIAQIYGGSVRQAQPNYANENDPLGPEIPMLDNVQEDDSYLGFSYGMNPEHERRTKEAAGKRIVSIPGMQDMELQAPQAQESHFSRLRSYLQSLPPSADQALAMRSIGQSEALGLDPHKTNEALEAARADQRMRDLAGQRRKGGGGRGGAGKPSDIRGDFTAFRTAANDWEKAANVDKLTDSWDKFRELGANVEDAKRSGDVISQRSALYQAARYITGPGVLTPQEYENTVSNTSGLIASALTKLQKKQDGQISDEEALALEKFVGNAQKAVKRRAESALKNFDLRFGSGMSATNPTMKGERDAYRNALIQRFDLPTPKADKDKALNSEADDLLKGIK